MVNENDPTQSLLGINDNDMKDEYMLWLKWIRQVRHRRRIIAMAVTTVIWLTALILVSYGAAKRHFVIHTTGSILAMLMATFTAAHSVLWGGSCLSRILGINGRTCEQGDTINPTAPQEEVNLCAKETAVERTEKKRERIRKEIETMKKEIFGEDMEVGNKNESKRNKKSGGNLDARHCESKC